MTFLTSLGNKKKIRLYVRKDAYNNANVGSVVANKLSVCN